jgi:hypothetical protein
MGNRQVNYNVLSAKRTERESLGRKIHAGIAQFEQDFQQRFNYSVLSTAFHMRDTENNLRQLFRERLTKVYVPGFLSKIGGERNNFMLGIVSTLVDERGSNVSDRDQWAGILAEYYAIKIRLIHHLIYLVTGPPIWLHYEKTGALSRVIGPAEDFASPSSLLKLMENNIYMFGNLIPREKQSAVRTYFERLENAILKQYQMMLDLLDEVLLVDDVVPHNLQRVFDDIQTVLYDRHHVVCFGLYRLRDLLFAMTSPDGNQFYNLITQRTMSRQELVNQFQDMTFATQAEMEDTVVCDPEGQVPQQVELARRIYHQQRPTTA